MKLSDVLGPSSRFARIPGRRRLACPACGRMVSFTVYRQANGLVLFGVPLMHRRALYFTACPCCAAAFSVLPAAGRRLAQEPHFPLLARFLFPVHPSARGYAPDSKK